MELLSTLLGSALGGGVVVGLAIYYLKTWTETRLKHEFDVRLAANKLELDKLLAIFESRTANVTARRIEAYVETYKLLSRAARAMRALVNPIQIVSKDAEQAHKDYLAQVEDVRLKSNAYLNQILENRPFFDDEIWPDLNEMSRELTRVWNRATRLQFGSRADEHLDDAYEIVEKKFDPLLLRINAKARKILGIAD